MRFWRYGMNVLEGMSPLGLVFAGIAIAAFAPAITKSLRCVGHAAVAGMSQTAEKVQKCGQDVYKEIKTATERGHGAESREPVDDGDGVKAF